ncbi:MAG TPA: hypothetical protein VIM39_05005 [Candidatus Limnocylindrales bacterium]
MRPHPRRVLFLIALLLAACNASTASPSAATSPAAAGSASASEGLPLTSEGPSASVPSGQESPSEAAADTPTPSSVEPSPSTSSGPDPAAACSGTAQNRDFFRAAATVMTWTVYCAVLPSGWFVDSGQYRQAAGGWIQIAYKGPGGARLELHEGAFCSASDGCVPPGTDSGDASFGDRTGTLVTLADGGWAVVVDRATAISWLAVGSGMDEATFRQLTGALATVSG